MLVEEELAAERIQRQDKWKKSIAVGSKEFVDQVQSKLVGRANGRKVQKDETGHQLREQSRTYSYLFGAQSSIINIKNAYYWDINAI